MCIIRGCLSLFSVYYLSEMALCMHILCLGTSGPHYFWTLMALWHFCDLYDDCNFMKVLSSFLGSNLTSSFSVF